MPAAHIINNNAKVIERTLKSINAEKKYYEQIKSEYYSSVNTNNEYKKEQKEFANGMLMKSQSYSCFFLKEKGDRAKNIIEQIYDKRDVEDACYVNVYDKSKKSIEKYKMEDVVKKILKTPNMESFDANKFGQVRFYNDLYLPEDIYKFVVGHHSTIKDTSYC